MDGGLGTGRTKDHRGKASDQRSQHSRFLTRFLTRELGHRAQGWDVGSGWAGSPRPVSPTSGGMYDHEEASLGSGVSVIRAGGQAFPLNWTCDLRQELWVDCVPTAPKRLLVILTPGKRECDLVWKM